MREWVSCLERLPELSGKNIDGKPYWEGVVFERSCQCQFGPWTRKNIDGKTYLEGPVFGRSCQCQSEPCTSIDGAIHIAYRDDKKFYYQERWTDLYCNIRHENYAEYWWMDCGIPPIDEIRAECPDFTE